MYATIMELTACIAESMICIHFICRYLGFRKLTNIPLKYAIFFTVIMLDEILATYVRIPEHFAVIAFITISTIFSAAFLKGKFLEKLLVACFTYFIIIAINMTVLSLFTNILTEKYSTLITQAGTARLFILLITKILLLFITLLILNFKEKSGFNLKKTECIAMLVTFILTSSVGLSVREMLRLDRLSPTLFLYIICCMIVLNIIIFGFLIKIIQNSRKETEIQLMRLQLMQQEKSMLETDQLYEETIKIRHDMKNYVSCALSLAENREYDKLGEYLREFSAVKLGKMRQYVKTDSKVVDAVLNNKLTAAAENNISIECVITGKTGAVAEMDLSILLSNLIDNAVEACNKNKISSRLRVDIHNNGSYLCIKIRNTYDKEVHGEKLSLKTTKADKSSHGLGLRSVKDIVEKYSGSMNLYLKDNEFIADIMLCSV